MLPRQQDAGAATRQVVGIGQLIVFDRLWIFAAVNNDILTW
jgi:hypothetical protein